MLRSRTYLASVWPGLGVIPSGLPSCLDYANSSVECVFSIDCNRVPLLLANAVIAVRMCAYSVNGEFRGCAGAQIDSCSGS
ncbi:hypothetical protein EDC04DRAFT_2701715 [Pisolithus marmoratus]|nr:hypothetical protein EDC04DRAFT_2701715 [Pisolithus marmoratus]